LGPRRGGRDIKKNGAKPPLMERTGRLDQLPINRLFERTAPSAPLAPRWILLAMFAFTPTILLAQQDKVQQEAKPAQTEQPTVQTETDKSQPQTGEDGKLISVPGGKALGMSILGNQEAPKALVIVPWKSSELGNVPGISTL